MFDLMIPRTILAHPPVAGECFEAPIRERLLGLWNVTRFANVLDSGRFRLDAQERANRFAVLSDTPIAVGAVWY